MTILFQLKIEEHCSIYINIDEKPQHPSMIVICLHYPNDPFAWSQRDWLLLRNQCLEKGREIPLRYGPTRTFVFESNLINIINVITSVKLFNAINMIQVLPFFRLDNFEITGFCTYSLHEEIHKGHEKFVANMTELKQKLVSYQFQDKNSLHLVSLENIDFFARLKFQFVIDAIQDYNLEKNSKKEPLIQFGLNKENLIPIHFKLIIDDLEKKLYKKITCLI